MHQSGLFHSSGEILTISSVSALLWMASQTVVRFLVNVSGTRYSHFPRMTSAMAR